MNGEIWLKSNRRALWVLAIPSAVGVFTCALWFSLTRTALWMGVSAALLVVMAGWLCANLYRLRLPRLAYCRGKLLVYLRGFRPIQVPVEIVECFFLGQGPSALPKALEGKHGEAAEASTIVVRLAESAKDWHHRDVRTSLGLWCEGYITIRGTWCEPLTGDLVIHLNKRLVEAHRALRSSANETVLA